MSQQPIEADQEAAWPSKAVFRAVTGASILATLLSGAALTVLVRDELTASEHGIVRIEFPDRSPQPGFELDLND